jgi:hypothetical protein
MTDQNGGPNNGPIKYPIDPVIGDCWIDATTTPNLAKYAADTSLQPYLNSFIVAACAGINKLCNRKFNTQEFDQVFMNDILWVRDYKVYPLQNRPVTAVNNVWLQIVNTWTSVVSTYWQLIPNEGIVKILPTFNPYALVTLPSYFWPVTTNIWVRFTSGYAKADVPMPVKIATSLYVDYLYSRSNLIGGISQFSTQTYSQTNAIGDQDPQFAAIKMLLEPYVLSYVA